jgi:ribonuclease HI
MWFMSIISERGLPLEKEVSKTVTDNIGVPDESDFLVFTDASVRESAVGIGWVITRQSGDLVCYGSQSFTGDFSSHKAEAMAVKSAYEHLVSMDWGDCNVQVFMDNESVVESFERETLLWDFEHGDIFTKISRDAVEYIDRCYNRAADALSKSARLSLDYTYTETG